MKTMSVDEAQANLPQALEWVSQGEEVDLMRDDRCVARLLPAFAQPAPATVWPDFAGRLRAIYGDTVLPGNAVLEERASYDR